MIVTQEQIALFKKHVLKVAKAFDAFCTENELRYFAIAGTAIGALRHKGFIPWDDDIDFVMPRPDYEKFLEIAPQLLPKEYEVLSHRNNKEYHLQFAKMCDANTSLLVGLRCHCMMGAVVDIFPMDGLPDVDADGRKTFFLKYLDKRNRAYYIRTHLLFTDYLRSLRRFDWKSICNQMCSDWNHLIKCNNDPYEECDSITMANPYDSAEYVAYFGTNHGPKMISPRIWFDSYYYAPFEDIQLRLPVGIDNYLRQVYGNDYMQLPPENKREARHSYYYLNLNKKVSYIEAINELKSSK